LIPIESAQHALLSISAQELKKGITPTNNPISNDLKQINMKPNFTYTKSKITFLFTGFLYVCW
jgi:hypothetical protein